IAHRTNVEILPSVFAQDYRVNLSTDLTGTNGGSASGSASGDSGNLVSATTAAATSLPATSDVSAEAHASADAHSLIDLAVAEDWLQVLGIASKQNNASGSPV